MNHYVYKLEDESGNYYFGSRSSKISPSDDKYMGSGYWPKSCRKNQVRLKKTVVKSGFSDRLEASKFEVALILLSHDDTMLCNRSTTVQNPVLGERVYRNPWSALLRSGMISAGTLPVLLYIELIGLNSTIGVSSVYFSRKASCTVKECDAALLIASSYTSGDLPSIYYSNGVWKIKMEGAN
jgi:hypothetical protein